MLSTKYVSYNLPFIFMIQEGCFQTPFWIFFLGWGMMTIMQLSLMINPFMLTKEIIQKYNLNIQSFLPQTLFLRCLSDNSIFNPYIFLEFNEKVDGKFVLNIRKFADFILIKLNWPTIDELLDCYHVDIHEDIFNATNKPKAKQIMKNILSENIDEEMLCPKGDLRSKQFKTFFKLCVDLWNDNKSLMNPINLLDRLPAPVFIKTVENGISCEPNSFWDVNYESKLSLMLHIGQKILYCNELSCYSDPFGESALVECQLKDQCIAVADKKGLSFCNNQIWLNLVNDFLSVNNICIEY